MILAAWNGGAGRCSLYWRGETMEISLAQRAARIELLILDVDGVLTDGRIVYGTGGLEVKQFHVRDGSGLKLWHLAGKRSALITGRDSPIVAGRAAELGIGILRQRGDEPVMCVGATGQEAAAMHVQHDGPEAVGGQHACGANQSRGGMRQPNRIANAAGCGRHSPGGEVEQSPWPRHVR